MGNECLKCFANVNLDGSILEDDICGESDKQYIYRSNMPCLSKVMSEKKNFKTDTKAICEYCCAEILVEKGVLGESFICAKMNGEIIGNNVCKLEEVQNDLAIKNDSPNTALKNLLGTNPKDLLGAKRVPLGLLPSAGIIYGAMAMEFGANKYGPYNWRGNKVIMSIYLDAMRRHIYSLLDGENDALDSKVHHLGHIIADCSILLDAMETGNLIDDRPKAGCAAQLLKKFNKEPAKEKL